MLLSSRYTDGVGGRWSLVSVPATRLSCKRARGIWPLSHAQCVWSRCSESHRVCSLLLCRGYLVRRRRCNVPPGVLHTDRHSSLNTCVQLCSSLLQVVNTFVSYGRLLLLVSSERKLVCIFVAHGCLTLRYFSRKNSPMKRAAPQRMKL